MYRDILQVSKKKRWTALYFEAERTPSSVYEIPPPGRETFEGTVYLICFLGHSDSSTAHWLCDTTSMLHWRRLSSHLLTLFVTAELAQSSLPVLLIVFVQLICIVQRSASCGAICVSFWSSSSSSSILFHLVSFCVNLRVLIPRGLRYSHTLNLSVLI